MSLANKGIWVTRPLPQGNNISRLIRENGGKAFVFPVLEIQPPNDVIAFERSLRNISQYDIVILVSLSAVNSFAAALGRLGLRIPDSVEVAVMGKRSAEECERHSITVKYLPNSSMDSEGLLREFLSVDLNQKKVMIVRGQSGRELLRDELSLKGASIHYAYAYRRSVTQQSPEALVHQWHNGLINGVVVTSNSIVDGALALLGKHAVLFKKTPIITISHRISNYCRDKGVFSSIHVANSPSDEDVLQCLIDSQTESI